MEGALKRLRKLPVPKLAERLPVSAVVPGATYVVRFGDLPVHVATWYGGNRVRALQELRAANGNKGFDAFWRVGAAVKLPAEWGDPSQKGPPPARALRVESDPVRILPGCRWEVSVTVQESMVVTGVHVVGCAAECERVIVESWHEGHRPVCLAPFSLARLLLEEGRIGGGTGTVLVTGEVVSMRLYNGGAEPAAVRFAYVGRPMRPAEPAAALPRAPRLPPVGEALARLRALPGSLPVPDGLCERRWRAAVAVLAADACEGAAAALSDVERVRELAAGLVPTLRRYALLRFVFRYGARDALAEVGAGRLTARVIAGYEHGV